VHVNKEAKLPPFPQVVDASFESAMKQDSTPLLVRARIWSWAPDEIKRRTWSRLGEVLAGQAKQAGLDPQRVFRPPPEPPAAAGERAGLQPEGADTGRIKDESAS